MGLSEKQEVISSKYFPRGSTLYSWCNCIKGTIGGSDVIRQKDESLCLVKHNLDC